MALVIDIIGWGVALFMLAATALLALNKQSGLTMIQHQHQLLPQAMLVRYLGLAALALLAAWLDAPRLLLAMLLSFAVIGFGDAFIYRRAGLPHWMHLLGGGAAAIGAAMVALSLR